MELQRLEIAPDVQPYAGLRLRSRPWHVVALEVRRSSIRHCTLCAAPRGKIVNGESQAGFTDVSDAPFQHLKPVANQEQCQMTSCVQDRSIVSAALSSGLVKCREDPQRSVKHTPQMRQAGLVVENAEFSGITATPYTYTG